MPFPEVQRVIYRRNPLDQVICQLRFPPILRIDAEIPAEFQERIRANFPNYSENSELKLEVPQGFKGAIPPDLLKQMIQPSGNKNYEFSSEDGLWKVNLTRTFVALTSNRYERWELFKKKLNFPLQALIDIYAPAYFSRIGLRYIDVIKRSALNLPDISWSELLKPYILGMLASPDIGNHVLSFENRHDIRLSDREESVVRIITGFVVPENNSEMCYMIDSDFHTTNKINLESALDKLDFFNVRGSRLFQWSITQRLHNAMEPQPL